MTTDNETPSVTRTLSIELKRHEPRAMFFDEVWMNGDAEDGTRVEMTRGVGGAYILFIMTKPDGTIVKETIDAGALLQTWANSLEKA